MMSDLATIARGYLLLCWRVLMAVAHGQTTRITGKVTDAKTGETLPFVNIAFIDSRIGTTTDINGNYSFDTYYATDSHPGLLRRLHPPNPGGAQGQGAGDQHPLGAEQRASWPR